jgi:hypothetical protein
MTGRPRIQKKMMCASFIKKSVEWASKFVASIGKMFQSINETIAASAELLLQWVCAKDWRIVLLVFFIGISGCLSAENEKNTFKDYVATAQLLLADERAQFISCSKNLKKDFFSGDIPVGGVALQEQKESIFKLIEKAFLEKKITEKKALNAWTLYYKYLFSLNALVLAHEQGDAGSIMKVLRAISAFGNVFEKDSAGVKSFSWKQKVQFLKELISFVAVIESSSRDEWTLERLEPSVAAIRAAIPECAKDHDPARCSSCGTRKTLEIVLIGLCEQKKWEDPEQAKEAKKTFIKVSGIVFLTIILWRMRSFLRSKVFN